MAIRTVETKLWQIKRLPDIPVDPVAKKETLYSEGDPAKEAYLLLWGVVKLTRRGKKGEGKIFGLIPAPSVLGYEALSEEQDPCYGYSATALTRLQIQKFPPLNKIDTNAVKTLGAALAERERWAREEIYNLGDPVSMRIAMAVKLVSQLQEDYPDFPRRLTKRDLSDLVRVSRKTLDNH